MPHAGSSVKQRVLSLERPRLTSRGWQRISIWELFLQVSLTTAQQVNQILRASLVAQMVKCLSAMQETQVRSLGREDPLEKEMATHSSILAWRIPWIEEPGRLQPTGSQSQTWLSNFASLHLSQFTNEESEHQGPIKSHMLRADCGLFVPCPDYRRQLPDRMRNLEPDQHTYSLPTHEKRSHFLIKWNTSWSVFIERDKFQGEIAG